MKGSDGTRSHMRIAHEELGNSHPARAGEHLQRPLTMPRSSTTSIQVCPPMRSWLLLLGTVICSVSDAAKTPPSRDRTLAAIEAGETMNERPDVLAVATSAMVTGADCAEEPCWVAVHASTPLDIKDTETETPLASKSSTNTPCHTPYRHTLPTSLSDAPCRARDCPVNVASFQVPPAPLPLLLPDLLPSPQCFTG